MNDYVIFTDSACDINDALLQKWGVKYVSLTFSSENTSGSFANDNLSIKDFYNKMREGEQFRTAAANIEDFKSAFRNDLTNGKDILYLGFSSGISTTYNSARIAANELLSEFPDRLIICIDSLSASAGFGLLLYLTVNKKLGGATIEEAAEFAKNNRLNIGHWFTVDDLTYLKRGGRISPAVAFVGGVLGIKPVLHVDNEGRLVNVTKARGRRAALAALADKYSELATDPSQGTVFISHGDCREDAEYLKNIIKERHGVNVKLITDIGPIIGSHSGPGTVALFFVCKKR